MKTLTLLLLLGLAFVQCKRNNDPEPSPEITGIVGEWTLIEMRYPSGDSTVIRNMTNEPQKAFSIRFDGVMLYDGYAACCPTSEYVVNGKPFQVKPLKDVPKNEDCFYVDCWICPKFVITQTGDAMTIESCLGLVSKYMRKK